MNRLLIIWMLCTINVVHAQKQDVLEGFIFDDGGHELPGATVFIKSLQKGAVSNQNGKFILKEVPYGDYILEVRYIGHEPENISCTVPTNQPITIKLSGEYHMLSEVIVAAKKDVLGLVTKNTLDSEQLKKTKGASLAETVNQITGVNMLQTGPAIAKPVIHGLHSNRVLILNNGVRQEGQQWGTEHAPEIDPFTAGEITVVKGAAAVRYGSDAVAGALLVEPSALPNENDFQGELNLIGTTNGRQGIGSIMLANGSDKLPGFGWRVQSSVKKAGDFHAPNYSLTNTGLEEINFSGETGYETNKWGTKFYYSLFTSETGILRSAHIGNLTDLQDALSRQTPFFVEDFSYQINNPRQVVAHHLIKSESFYRFTDNSKLTLSLSRQQNNREEYDIRRGDRDNRPALDLSIITNQADLVYEGLFGSDLKSTYGISFLDQKNRNIPGTGVRPLIPNFLSTSFGVFAIQNLSKGQWEFEAGARYDYKSLEAFKFNEDDELITPDYNFHNFSLTGSVAYNFNDFMSINSQLATAFRPPNVSELFSEGLHHGLAAIEEGNPNLETEKAVKWINTFEYSKQPFGFTASLYYQQIQDFIYLRPLGEPRLTVRGAFPVFQYTQTNARIAGIDMAFDWQMAPWLSYVLRYSMVRARDITENTSLIYMPADQAENEIKFQKENIGRFNKFYAGFTAAYHAEQTRVPGIDFAPPPDAYFLLNFNTGVDFNMGAKEAGVSLTINNTLNNSYRSYLNRLRYYADEMGRNLIFRFYMNI